LPNFFSFFSPNQSPPEASGGDWIIKDSSFFYGRVSLALTFQKDSSTNIDKEGNDFGYYQIYKTMFKDCSNRLLKILDNKEISDKLMRVQPKLSSIAVEQV